MTTNERLNQNRKQNLIWAIENWADGDGMLQYQKDVPMVHVPSEMFEQVFDMFDSRMMSRNDWSVLNDEEYQAVQIFEQELIRQVKNSVFDGKIEDVLASQPYAKLKSQAQTCLVKLSKPDRSAPTFVAAQRNP